MVHQRLKYHFLEEEADVYGYKETFNISFCKRYIYISEPVIRLNYEWEILSKGLEDKEQKNLLEIIRNRVFDLIWKSKREIGLGNWEGKTSFWENKTYLWGPKKILVSHINRFNIFVLTCTP